MQVSEKNCRIADKIIEVLAEERCTIEDAQDILSIVAREVRKTSIVQMGEKLSKIYYD